MKKNGIFVSVICACALVLVHCQSSTTKENSEVLSQQRGAAGKILDKSGYYYDPQDTSCDGFPRLDVETIPGTCLGLVMSQNRGTDEKLAKGFSMPRTILQIPNSNDFLVTDMGGWHPKNGRMYLLKKDSSGGGYSLQLLKFPLNMPHGLTLGTDGYIYLGETDQISRFHFDGQKIKDWQLVTNKIPRPGGDMHPLSQIVFDPRNQDLYVNAGAPTDHCQTASGVQAYSACPDTTLLGLGSIYRIPGEKLKNIPSDGIPVSEVAAQGLRNSMAMAIHPSGYLIQGENGRDFAELTEPYEEINVIDLENRGNHYGWPYCYDFHGVSPEWRGVGEKAGPGDKRGVTPVDCRDQAPSEIGAYQPPYALMPPHTAPLSMTYYHGAMFSSILEGQLLVAWHGYQPTGHRLVAYSVDNKGRPLLSKDKKLNYSFDQGEACPTTREYTPKNGADRLAPYTEIIFGWNEIKGVRPKGAPVGMTIAKDGSIWIVEDKNKTIVRLAKVNDKVPRKTCQNSHQPQLKDPRIDLLSWRHTIASDPELVKGYAEIENHLINKFCLGCHGDMKSTALNETIFSRLDFFTANHWLEPGNPSASKIYQAISQSGEIPGMPPSGSQQFYGTEEGAAVLKLVADWIKALPVDADQRVSRVKLDSPRTLRDQPSLSTGTDCASLPVGTQVWVDPRTSAQIKESGWIWSVAYLTPDDPLLKKSGCTVPVDGVYYLPLRTF